MEVLLSWQMYVILGLGLIILEAFVSTFFLFPLGVSLLLVALIAPIAGPEVELITFGLLSIFNFFISIKYVKPYFRAKTHLTGVDSMIGRIVSVDVEINENARTGSVKIYADEWNALPTELGQIIAKNERVKIDKVVGNKVYVSRV